MCSKVTLEEILTHARSAEPVDTRIDVGRDNEAPLYGRGVETNDGLNAASRFFSFQEGRGYPLHSQFRAKRSTSRLQRRNADYNHKFFKALYI